MAAAVTHDADIGAEPDDLPVAAAAWMRLGKPDPVAEPERDDWLLRARHQRRQCCVVPVNVNAEMRRAGTSDDPRNPRISFRELPTASTPASASR